MTEDNEHDRHATKTVQIFYPALRIGHRYGPSAPRTDARAIMLRQRQRFAD